MYENLTFLIDTLFFACKNNVSLYNPTNHLLKCSVSSTSVDTKSWQAQYSIII